MNHHFFIKLLLCLLLSCMTANTFAKDKKVASNWMMYTTKGTPVELYADLEQGNAVVIIFWATWCKFCADLFPKLTAHIQAQDDLGKVKFYAMNIWENADPLRYIKENNISMDVILKADSIARRYKVKGTPGFYVIAPDKTILYHRRSGHRTDRIIESMTKALNTLKESTSIDNTKKDNTIKKSSLKPTKNTDNNMLQNILTSTIFSQTKPL